MLRHFNELARCRSHLLVAMSFIVGLITTTTAHSAEPKKVALLVGVNKYMKAGLTNLDFPEADVDAVGAELTKLGFQVTILKGSSTGKNQATRENLEAFANSLVKPLGKDDLMLVMLSGHGMQLEVIDANKNKHDDGFYCPYDTITNDPTTLFSLSHLTDDILAPNVGKKLVLVDACRNIPKDPGRGKGIQGKLIALPENTAVLFGCRAGQQSFENDKLGHGLFTHCLLEGLQGKAAREGKLTWTNLAGYIEGRLSDDDMKTLMPKDSPQEAIAAGGVGQLVLARIDAIAAPVERVAVKLLAPFDEKTAVAARSAWAKKIGQDETITTKTVNMKFTLIPPGTFMMGNEESVSEALKEFPYAKKEWLEDASRQHRVTITKPFYLGTYSVTLKQFLEFYHDAKYKCDCEKDGKGGLGYTGEKFEQKVEFVPWSWGFKEQTMNHPVVNVSWNDAAAFCQWLSKKEGKKYRLPTEAEWEYACRAGTTTRYSFGNDPEGLVKYANVNDATAKAKFPAWENSHQSSDGYAFTAPVGSFRPNAFGLYDMHGNVLQWCGDWYDADYYANSPESDPTGPNAGSYRVYRGGCWDYDAANCRSADRNRGTPDFRCHRLGFRVALVPSS